MTDDLFDFSDYSDNFYDDLSWEDFEGAQDSTIKRQGEVDPDDLEAYYGIEISPPEKEGPEKLFENVCDYYASKNRVAGQTYMIRVKLVCNICGRSDGWEPIMGMVDGVEQIVAFGCEHEDDMITEGLPIRKICTVGTTFSGATRHPTGSYLMGDFQCEEVYPDAK